MIEPPYWRPVVYLEMDDANASTPVLECWGQAWIEIGEPYDTVLLCELRAREKIVWGSCKSCTTDVIALTGSKERSITTMDDYPFPLPVTVLLPKSEKARCVEDFECIARGRVYPSLPTACLVWLGYAPG